MKRLALIVLVLLVVGISVAGCGYDPLKDPNRNSSNTTETTAATQATEAKVYKDNYNGLEEYMKDKEYIETKNRVEMQAEIIGAKKGYRYTKDTVNIELYQYDVKNLSDEANKIIESVKSNGYYTIYDKKITAYLSNNGKYLMIYNDATVKDKESPAYKTQQQVIKDFKNFLK